MVLNTKNNSQEVNTSNNLILVFGASSSPLLNIKGENAQKRIKLSAIKTIVTDTGDTIQVNPNGLSDLDFVTSGEINIENIIQSIQNATSETNSVILSQYSGSGEESEIDPNNYTKTPGNIPFIFLKISELGGDVYDSPSKTEHVPEELNNSNKPWNKDNLYNGRVLYSVIIPVDIDRDVRNITDAIYTNNSEIIKNFVSQEDIKFDCGSEIYLSLDELKNQGYINDVNEFLKENIIKPSLVATNDATVAASYEYKLTTIGEIDNNISSEESFGQFYDKYIHDRVNDWDDYSWSTIDNGLEIVHDCVSDGRALTLVIPINSSGFSYRSYPMVVNHHDDVFEDDPGPM